MIYAIKHRKVDRAIFKGNEDSFTSSIFERLMYLPLELTQQILETALLDLTIDLDLHKTESIEYWPNWSAENTTNKNRVEPDIFIRTKKFDIIIEAKRHDKNSQHKGQWVNELQSYFNEYAVDEKEVIYIALGGIRKFCNESISINDKNLVIHKCYWSSILESVKTLSYKMVLTKDLTSQNSANSKILEDIILCFSLFGFSTADWLEYLPKTKYINEKSLRDIKKLEKL